MVVALTGNKADLSSQRDVEEEEAKKYATDNGLLFLETSVRLLSLYFKFHSICLWFSNAAHCSSF